MQIKIGDIALTPDSVVRSGGALTLTFAREAITLEQLFEIFPTKLNATLLVYGDAGEIDAKYSVTGVPEVSRIEGVYRAVLHIAPLELTAEDKLTARVDAQDRLIAEQATVIRAQAERLAAMAVHMDALAAIGMHTERVQSDKIGYDWIIHSIGDTPVKWEYAAQETPVGTADNPFTWGEDVPLIPNAYYTHDGVRKVWTGEASTESVEWTDERWEEF